MTFLRPALAALILSTPFLPAQAGWTELGGNEQVTFYADFDGVNKSKDAVAIWTLVDSKKPRTYEGKVFSSVRTQFEFQCAGPKVRERETRFHAGAMAAGELVASYKVEEPAWEPVTGGTVKDALAQELCKPAAAK
ncbi:surface-adhesin E family protein [Aquariibacter albus]|uniref:Surface-adhesin protein E-like domain-containing protein n=1 Tax=Aquariibacter albus TaxID=2759899 RepID=A0A839HKX7_9BURK|nr:surface-adhesin E family protein [Aquariibacter albus]MBB1161812.1 hypothetical protein [Aquariibacter albus]